ncbi:MAG: TlpA disulfide reductase family protein [Patescibacteria group bacterium]
MNKQSLIWLFGLLFVAVVLAVATWFSLNETASRSLKESAAGVALTEPGETALYTDLSGNSLDLSNYLGKILIVHSWASWCPQCVTELQFLDQLGLEYQDRLQVLAINRAEPAATAERYLAAVAAGDRIKFLLDPADHFYTSNNGYAMPETIVYEESGAIVLHVHGEIDKVELKTRLEELLSE